MNMLNVRPLVYLGVFLSCVGTWANRSVSKSGSNTNLLPDLYWNTSNPIFRIDNTDHIIDVNKSPQSRIYDQINIICPVYDESIPEQETERYVIYNVNKEEYETCRILSQHPRIVAGCTEPYTPRFFTISFRSFSPLPNMLEFKAGEDYYFISTSSKDDIHRRIHGDCRNHNMKVVFKVADKSRRQKTPRLFNLPASPSSSSVPTSFKFVTERSQGEKLYRPSNYTSYYVNTDTRRQQHHDHVSLVKKVRDKIKQEASTKIASGSTEAGLSVLLALLVSFALC